MNLKNTKVQKCVCKVPILLLCIAAILALLVSCVLAIYDGYGIDNSPVRAIFWSLVVGSVIFALAGYVNGEFPKKVQPLMPLVIISAVVVLDMVLPHTVYGFRWMPVATQDFFWLFQSDFEFSFSFLIHLVRIECALSFQVLGIIAIVSLLRGNTPKKFLKAAVILRGISITLSLFCDLQWSFYYVWRVGLMRYYIWMEIASCLFGIALFLYFSQNHFEGIIKKRETPERMLREIALQREQGLISDEEYRNARREILRNIK